MAQKKLPIIIRRGSDDPVTLSRLERGLRMFTDVRPGEAPTAILMFANVFLILCAYYFIKPLREGWIAISDITGLTKMEVRAYSSFGQSVLLVFVIAAYARLSDRLSRNKLITRSTLFCISNILIFWVIQPGLFFDAVPFAGIAFYLWVGMFGVFVVAQFFAFAADLYTDERGRRMLPMIAIGATGGAWAGSEIAESLVRLMGAETLLLLAVLPLIASIVLTSLADLRGPVGEGWEAVSPGSPAERTGRGALSLVLTSRFLLAVTAITIILNWVNTNGENLLFRVVHEAVEENAALAGLSGAEELKRFIRDGMTAFYGNFYSWVNGIALVLQAFVASRLLKYGGFAAILLLLPVIALVSYSTMALLPLLGVVKAMKIAENATDYSINNTARHVLWLPTTAEMKYKGKPTIDTFFARVGDGMAALTVVVGVQMYALATETFFAFNVVLVLLWLGLSALVIREHRRLSAGVASDDHL